MADTDDMDLIRVGVLGVSVDNSIPHWTLTPPPQANNLSPTLPRIITRVLNNFETEIGGSLAVTGGFAARFNAVIGNENTAPDQAAFQGIGSNLIQAVAALKEQGTGGGGGAGLLVGPNPPADVAAYPFWFDDSIAQLFVYDGSTWVIAVNPAGGGGGGSGPSNGGGYDSVNPNLTAGTPIAQGNAVGLGSQTNLVTGPSGGGAVRWDSPQPGDHRFIHNGTASAITFYPPVGGRINNMEVNAGIFILPNVTGFIKAIIGGSSARLVTVP